MPRQVSGSTRAAAGVLPVEGAPTAAAACRGCHAVADVSASIVQSREPLERLQTGCKTSLRGSESRASERIRTADLWQVNLFLRVVRRREDGFHDLASLFHVIDLGDRMTFAVNLGTLVLRCRCAGRS